MAGARTMTVAERLAASRDAHRQYRQHAGRVDKDGTVTAAPDPDGALDALRRALRHLRQADQNDPTHADPAWDASHVALLAFYADQIARRGARQARQAQARVVERR